MFDLIAGLPLHPLLVHAAVVLLPVMGVVTPLVVARARWRPALRWVVAADFVTFVCTFATAQAGESLQSRLSQAAGHQVAQDHGRLGHLLAPLALLLFLAALGALFAVRRGGFWVPAAVVAVSLVGVLGVGLTLVVGHSGAQASWEQRVANTPPPQDN